MRNELEIVTKVTIDLDKAFIDESQVTDEAKQEIKKMFEDFMRQTLEKEGFIRDTYTVYCTDINHI